MEESKATTELMASLCFAWVLLSFSPFSVGHSAHEHGTTDVCYKLIKAIKVHDNSAISAKCAMALKMGKRRYLSGQAEGQLSPAPSRLAWQLQRLFLPDLTAQSSHPLLYFSRSLPKDPQLEQSKNEARRNESKRQLDNLHKT